MASVFSSGFASGCYYQIQRERDKVKVLVATPLEEKETILSDYDHAKRWIDREVAAYLSSVHYED